jgi:hypothetical protein
VLARNGHGSPGESTLFGSCQAVNERHVSAQSRRQYPLFLTVIFSTSQQHIFYCFEA